MRCFAVFALGVASALRATSSTDERTHRDFVFTYEAVVKGLPPGTSARVWAPVASSDEAQTVTLLRRQPADSRIATEPAFGNRVLYFEAKAGADGTIPLHVTYRVQRRELKADAQSGADDRASLERFLQADALVPVGGKCLELLKGRAVPDDPVAAARLFYDITNSSLRYSKDGVGWGRGDAVWACGSGYGNCTDFHSVFIALARSRRLPAKFEIGFALPETRGKGEVAGYHCWAQFRPAGRGWLPVDISEANRHPAKRDYYFGSLSADRVRFSVGRDLALVPLQAGPPLNFFVYPYVEVDGQPYAPEMIERRFTYEDAQP